MKIFEPGDKRNFLTCEISDYTPSAHAQSDIPGHAFRKLWLFTETSRHFNLQKHTEPLRSYPRFCRTPFVPSITKGENGLLESNRSTVIFNCTVVPRFQSRFI